MTERMNNQLKLIFRIFSKPLPMIKKRVIKSQTIQKAKPNRIGTIFGNIILFLGALLIISSMIYLLVNLDKSDKLVRYILPVIVGGILLVLVSLLINPWRHKMRRKRIKLFRWNAQCLQVMILYGLTSIL